ncbi:MAG: efflux RND transporter periplasmic adaptor subunit, partial [Chloroflexota bacterium]
AEQQLAKARYDLQAAEEDHADLLERATETEVLAAKATLVAAEQEVADLQEPATKAEIAAAEAAVLSAQDAYDKLVNGPDATQMEQAQLNLSKAKNSLWAAQMSRDAKGAPRDKDSGSYDQAQVSVLNGEISVRQAEMDLAALKEPATAAALREARAKVLQAQEALAKLKAGPTAAALASAQVKAAQAQEALDDLLAGPSAAEIAASEQAVAQAKLTVAQAELNLESAKRGLNATALIAPRAATVMVVNAQVGERVGSTAIITLADLTSPVLKVFVDETDMDQIAVGYEVEVTFDAIKDKVFTGHILRIDPALVTESNTQVLRAVAALDADSVAQTKNLPMGLNATVDIIAGRATDAVLVPVEALRQIDAKEYAVFVVENGTPLLRVVEVGLNDGTYAEVKSGLQGGETLSTGMVEMR